LKPRYVMCSGAGGSSDGDWAVSAFGEVAEATARRLPRMPCAKESRTATVVTPLEQVRRKRGDWVAREAAALTSFGIGGELLDVEDLPRAVGGCEGVFYAE